MYNIDLNLYKTFYVVAKHNNFTKASESLCISQPAVTQAIKKLEKQLNVELFKRTSQGITLTKAGELVYYYSEHLCNLVESNVNLISQINLLKESKGDTIEEKLTDLLANYSYTVEINTAKFRTKSEVDFEAIEWDELGFPTKYKNRITGEIKDVIDENSFLPTQHYSNLTVPGGTNGSYREQNFETPLIKVPKSHAQFNTENTIGFNRNDDRQVYTEKDINSLLEIMQKSGILEVKC